MRSENGGGDIPASVGDGSTGSAAPTMRAAVVTGPGQIRLDATRIPEPGPGQVRIRLEGCGVCASNLTPWAGPEWMQFPTEPGGEHFGMVFQKGNSLVRCVNTALSKLRSGGTLKQLQQKWLAKATGAPTLK